MSDEIDPELAALFEGYWRGQLESLHAAAERSDFDELRRLAHNMRGSAAQFGHAELSRAALAVEAAAQSRDAVAVAFAASQLSEMA